MLTLSDSSSYYLLHFAAFAIFSNVLCKKCAINKGKDYCWKWLIGKIIKRQWMLYVIFNKTIKYAIQFSEQLSIRSEPNDRSEILFVLHKGTKVQVTDSLQEWEKINIANGASGWIKNASLKNLN